MPKGRRAPRPPSQGVTGAMHRRPCMISRRSSLFAFIWIVLVPILSNGSYQQEMKLWAAISVSEPVFDEGWTESIMIHFTLVNDATRTIDPKERAWRLVINGEDFPDPGFIFGTGPRDDRWKALPAGDSLRFSKALGRYFKEPGIYRVSWKGEGFETLPIEFRVMPKQGR
jgi:hypothetical protein